MLSIASTLVLVLLQSSLTSGQDYYGRNNDKQLLFNIPDVVSTVTTTQTSYVMRDCPATHDEPISDCQHYDNDITAVIDCQNYDQDITAVITKTACTKTVVTR